MDRLFDNLDIFLREYFDLTWPEMGIIDGVEIIIISFFSYMIFKWVKNTRAWMLLRGMLFIVLFFVLAALLKMNTILWLGEKLISMAALAIVIVFQPELRYALEHLGRKNVLTKFLPTVFGRKPEERFNNNTLEALLDSCVDMSKVKTGALIVIERDVALGEFIRTGIVLDSIVSRQLIVNIFEKNTPLHDGAVIIRGNRVLAATCYLPLSPNTKINKDLGTRHRAALGISEVSDSVTLIVSEETGKISVAEGGVIKRSVTPEKLKELLVSIQDIESFEDKKDNEQA